MLRNTDTTSSSSKAANTRRFYARELRSALPHCQPKPRERLNHNFQSCQTSVIRSSSCSMRSKVAVELFHQMVHSAPTQISYSKTSMHHCNILESHDLEVWFLAPGKWNTIECWAAEPATSPVLTFLGTLHLVCHASDLWPVGKCFSNERIPLTVMVLQTV